MIFKEGNKVTIAAPGTIANLVCGFDVLGLCLNTPEDTMELTMIEEKKVIIRSTDKYNLPTEPSKNTA
ncbi:MAG: hypothetical protein ABI091_08335, partial [Ferruginibacter sp.]